MENKVQVSVGETTRHLRDHCQIQIQEQIAVKLRQEAGHREELTKALTEALTIERENRMYEVSQLHAVLRRAPMSPGPKIVETRDAEVGGVASASTSGIEPSRSIEPQRFLSDVAGPEWAAASASLLELRARLSEEISALQSRNFAGATAANGAVLAEAASSAGAVAATAASEDPANLFTPSSRCNSSPAASPLSCRVANAVPGVDASVTEGVALRNQSGWPAACSSSAAAAASPIKKQGLQALDPWRAGQ